MKMNKILSTFAILALVSMSPSHAIQVDFVAGQENPTIVQAGKNEAVLMPVSSGVKIKIELAQGQFDLGEVNTYSDEMMAKLKELQDSDYTSTNGEAYIQVDCQAILKDSPASDFSTLDSELAQLPASSNSSEQQEIDEYTHALNTVVNASSNVQPLGCALYARQENATWFDDMSGETSTVETDNIFLVVVTPNIARVMNYSGPQAEITFGESSGLNIMASNLLPNGWLRSQTHATSDGNRNLLISSGIGEADSTHPIAIVAQGHQYRLSDLIGNPGAQQSHTIAMTMSYAPQMVVQ